MVATPWVLLKEEQKLFRWKQHGNSRTANEEEMNSYVGAEQITKIFPRYYHCYPVQEQRGKSDSSSLYPSKTSRKDSAEETGTHNPWRTPFRESVRLHSQQEHKRHGICSLASPREVLGVKQGSVYNFCWFDESIQHSEQKKNVADHGTARLSLKVPEHDQATRKPTWPSQMLQWPLKAHPDHQPVEECCFRTPTLFTMFVSLMLKQTRKILMMGTESTLNTVLMTACYKPTKRPGSNWSETQTCPRWCSCGSQRKNFAVHHFLIKRLPSLWARN